MIHHINFRVIAHATEDLSGVGSALDFFLASCLTAPGSSQKDELSGLTETIKTEGHFNNPIHIKTAVLKKKSACSKFVQFFKENITDEDLETLRSQMTERLDDDLNFFMRFSKQDAAAGRLRFTESSDAVFVRVKIETYPKSWEKAGPIVEELFGCK
ncbi:MAG: exosome subunit [Methanimicrococcus sp.]|nr:exosome subunit [Methanimicrococcus sp.]